MVQKEFAEKLISTQDHKAVSILANYGFEIKLLMNVKKSNFFPIPKVDSVIIFAKTKESAFKSAYYYCKLYFFIQAQNSSKYFKTIWYQFYLKKTSR